MINFFKIKPLSLILLILLIALSKPTLAQAARSSLIKTKPAIQKGISYHAVTNINEYWVSEKLDGIRGYWDGKQLFTRQGNKISAPAWFTQHWPEEVIDGELWIARAQFEQVSAIIRQQQASASDWQKVHFMIFDLPKASGNFSQRIKKMRTLVAKANSPSLKIIKQEKFSTVATLFKQLDQVVNQGGEGLMLHHQDALYQIGRVNHLMKLKKYYDAEALVIKHHQGKGKFSNILGALTVKTPDGIVFKIGSGFSNQQRLNPPAIGTTITYKYFGKTKNGIPRFASFMHIRND
jgi:DNA ligase